MQFMLQNNFLQGGNTTSMAKHISIECIKLSSNAILDCLRVEKTPPTPSAAAAAGEPAQFPSSSTQSSSGKHTKTCRKSRQLKTLIQS